MLTEVVYCGIVCIGGSIAAGRNPSALLLSLRGTFEYGKAAEYSRNRKPIFCGIFCTRFQPTERKGVLHYDLFIH